MSIDLEVKLSKKIELVKIVALAHSTLKEILGIAEVPQLHFAEIFQGVRRTITCQILGEARVGYLIGIDGFEEEVQVGTIRVERADPYVPTEKAGLIAYIAVGGVRTSLDIALAAALAIAIAELSDTPVFDSAEMWTYINEQNSTDFKKMVAVTGSYTDIYEAAEVFVHRLPMAGR